MENSTQKDNQGIFTNVDETIKLTSELMELVTEYQSTPDNQSNQTFLNTINEKSRSILERMNQLPYSIDQTRKMIQDILSNIHTSRVELKSSAEGLIQKTGNQLEKVTAATEDATNKIMDVTEKLGNDMMDMTENIEKVRTALSDGASDDVNNSLDTLSAKLQEGQMDTYQIMDYLQFQDITTQQISHAYSLLGETEKKLLFVASLLEGLDTSMTEGGEAKPKAAFDPEADFNSDHAKDNQSMIDDIFNNKPSDQ